jgi:hypothetical protein
MEPMKREQQLLLLPKETRTILKKLAEKDGRSLSRYVEFLLKKVWLQNDKAN